MCWRGHGVEHRAYDRDGSKHCRRCHMLRMRAYRSGYPTRRRPLFVLNAPLAKGLKRRHRYQSWKVVSELCGISKDFMADLLYKHHRTGEQNARNLAVVLRCDFAKLWS
jgi:hypothetical protein